MLCSTTPRQAPAWHAFAALKPAPAGGMVAACMWWSRFASAYWLALKRDASTRELHSARAHNWDDLPGAANELDGDVTPSWLHTYPAQVGGGQRAAPDGLGGQLQPDQHCRWGDEGRAGRPGALCLCHVRGRGAAEGAALGHLESVR